MIGDRGGWEEVFDDFPRFAKGFVGKIGVARLLGEGFWGKGGGRN